MDGREVLSAAEGADRVAARWQSQRPDNAEDETFFQDDGSGDYGDDDTPYACENCGSSEFSVFYYFDEAKKIGATLDCTCDAGGEAAYREILITRKSEWVGRLKADHRVEWQERECESEREILESNDFCRCCVSSAKSQDWQETDLSDFEAEDSREQIWEVGCAEFAHEIEFGWSHPDRGGRIWPCESRDHNPWRSWPEPRFVEDWKRRGWLRPLTREGP